MTSSYKLTANFVRQYALTIVTKLDTGGSILIDGETLQINLGGRKTILCPLSSSGENSCQFSVDHPDSIAQLNSGTNNLEFELFTRSLL